MSTNELYYNGKNITMPLEDTKKLILRYPIGVELKYVVQDDGIYEKQFEYDQFGEVYTEYSRPVMSREAFIEAFERYIKE